MSHAHVSRSTYFKIYAALMALLAATIGAAYLHLGVFNFPVAMAIAVVKAVLVVMFFMHVKVSPRWIWVFSVVGFVWLMCLLIGAFADYLTRSLG